MVVVRLPGILAAENAGQKRVEVTAGTVREALEALPVKNLVLDEHGAVRPLVNIYVDGRDARTLEGLETPLETGSEILVVAAVAGG